MKVLSAWFRILRPKALVWFGVSSTLGFGAMILQSPPPIEYGFFIGLIIITNAGAILTNDIGDVESDKLSVETSRLSRPIVTGEISIRTATIVSVSLYLLALIASWFLSLAAFIYVATIIMFSVSYSLPPIKLNGRPYGSFFYWIVLVVVCFLLLMVFFEDPDFNAIKAFLSGSSTFNDMLQFEGRLFWNQAAWTFFLSILFFMGIAEILAKDLRDMNNDLAGGRYTFVNRIGYENSAMIIPIAGGIGVALWIIALYQSNVFASSPFPWVVSIVGLMWFGWICIRCNVLRKQYDQTMAAQLHNRWTLTYLTMQFGTYLSFI